jgi:hypothetical protein
MSASRVTFFTEVTGRCYIFTKGVMNQFLVHCTMMLLDNCVLPDICHLLGGVSWQRPRRAYSTTQAKSILSAHLAGQDVVNLYGKF